MFGNVNWYTDTRQQQMEKRTSENTSVVIILSTAVHTVSSDLCERATPPACRWRPYGASYRSSYVKTSPSSDSLYCSNTRSDTWEHNTTRWRVKAS